MSGRDVRRLAAQATNMTHEAKRDIVARVAAGAHATGATDIFVTKEPFRIASLALQHLGLDVRVHLLDPPIANTAADTETAVRAYLDAGCTTLVSVGGDGTNRAIARALLHAGQAAEVTLIPLSTGTNNVFPVLAEPTIAGMVAGLVAGRRLDGAALGQRTKLLHVSGSDAAGATVADVGLIDAVLLKRDFVGNMLPFDARRINRILLTRAEPNAVGTSPIGGLLDVVEAADDEGLLVEMGHGVEFSVPLSPGAFQRVSVRSLTRVPLDMPVVFRGPGVLALDGDRDHKLAADGGLTVCIRRDGPNVVDLDAAMRWVVGQGIIAPSLNK
ncbi:MAG: NAD(+)/NADH kinase [Gammaproteobacteria bacterium]|nr:NAD(+)/NADH kinase [Gammaproteobacteria bacterium]